MAQVPSRTAIQVVVTISQNSTNTVYNKTGYEQEYDEENTIQEFCKDSIGTGVACAFVPLILILPAVVYLVMMVLAYIDHRRKILDLVSAREQRESLTLEKNYDDKEGENEEETKSNQSIPTEESNFKTPSFTTTETTASELHLANESNDSNHYETGSKTALTDRLRHSSILRRSKKIDTKVHGQETEKPKTKKKLRKRKKPKWNEEEPASSHTVENEEDPRHFSSLNEEEPASSHTVENEEDPRHFSSLPLTELIKRVDTLKQTGNELLFKYDDQPTKVGTQSSKTKEASAINDHKKIKQNTILDGQNTKIKSKKKKNSSKTKVSNRKGETIVTARKNKTSRRPSSKKQEEWIDIF